MLPDNFNVVSFRQDDTNLRHVFEEHIIPDMICDEFKKLCGECWCNQHDFITIVKEFDLNSGRYRKGFDQYIHIKK